MKAWPAPPGGWTLCVAPMMDWTDRHCRYFHRLLAPDARLYTEMVHAQAVVRGDRARLLDFDAAERPVALQLGGSGTAELAAAARIGEMHGYDEVNLNVGCPSDRVQAGRFGACLMREPALVADCVAAMRAVVAVPVTVKCRLGVDELEDYDHFRSFVDTVAAAGCTTFIVHARKAWLEGLSPKQNREVPPLRPDWALRLKRERADLIVVLNGGLADAAAVQASLPHVDGVMLGRAAYQDPYLLHRLQRQLFDGDAPPRTREALLRGLGPHVERHLRRGGRLRDVTRHVLGLFHREYGGRIFRQVLSEAGNHPGAGWEVVEQALAATRRPSTAAA